MKIKIEETSDGTDVSDYALRGYDYEGFKEIIDEYGADWAEPWSRQMTLDDMEDVNE